MIKLSMFVFFFFCTSFVEASGLSTRGQYRPSVPLLLPRRKTLQEPGPEICGNGTCGYHTDCPDGCICGLVLKPQAPKPLVRCYYASLVSCGEEFTCENHGICPDGCFCRYNDRKNGCFITQKTLKAFDEYIDWDGGQDKDKDKDTETDTDSEDSQEDWNDGVQNTDSALIDV